MPKAKSSNSSKGVQEDADLECHFEQLCLIDMVWDCTSNEVLVQGDGFASLGYSAAKTPKTMQEWLQLLHAKDEKLTEHINETMLQGDGAADFMKKCCRVRAASGEYVTFVGMYRVTNRDASGKALNIHITLCSDFLRAKNNTLQEFVPGHRDVLQINSAISCMHNEEGELTAPDKERCLLLNIGNDGVWEWDVKNDRVTYSKLTMNSLGYEFEELPKSFKDYIALLHPDDAARAKVGYEKVFTSNSAGVDYLENTYRIRSKEGEYRWILSRSQVLKRGTKGEAEKVFGFFLDVTNLYSIQEALIQMSHYDSLTKVCNRFYFDKRVSETSQSDYPISIICVDIDGLKLTNDNLGHAVGDNLLVNVATLLRESLPDSALIGRVGGDEFTVLLCNCDKLEVRKMVKGLYAAMYDWNKTHPDPVFFALGSATTITPEPVHKLIVKADKRMLTAKKRNRFKHRAIICEWITKQTGTPVDLMDRRVTMGGFPDDED